MISKPEAWARGNIRDEHSKSSAYAHGFRVGWDAALAAVRSKVDDDGLIDQHAIMER